MRVYWIEMRLYWLSRAPFARPWMRCARRATGTLGSMTIDEMTGNLPSDVLTLTCVSDFCRLGALHGRSAHSTTLANAVLCPLILLLNFAVEIGRPRGLGNAGVRQGFPGPRQVIRMQRLSRRVAGRCWDDASISGLLGPGREPEARGDKEYGE
jgi:hypothetical protein